jgi:hypothetical protein
MDSQAKQLKRIVECGKQALAKDEDSCPEVVHWVEEVSGATDPRHAFQRPSSLDEFLDAVLVLSLAEQFHFDAHFENFAATLKGLAEEEEALRTTFPAEVQSYIRLRLLGLMPLDETTSSNKIQYEWLRVYWQVEHRVAAQSLPPNSWVSMAYYCPKPLCAYLVATAKPQDFRWCSTAVEYILAYVMTGHRKFLEEDEHREQARQDSGAIDMLKQLRSAGLTKALLETHVMMWCMQRARPQTSGPLKAKPNRMDKTVWPKSDVRAYAVYEELMKSLREYVVLGWEEEPRPFYQVYVDTLGSYASDTFVCNFCGTLASLRASAVTCMLCRGVRICSKTCFEKHRPGHERDCPRYRMLTQKYGASV